MTAAIYDFRRSLPLAEAPPLSPTEDAPPLPRRPALFLRFIRFFFRSAPKRDMEPGQSRPATSSAVRDGGAPEAYVGELPAFLRREPATGPGVRQIRPAASPMRTEDYRPKAALVPDNLDAIRSEIETLLRECPLNPKPAPAPASAFNAHAMRAKVRRLPRCRIKEVAATIGCDPGALWGFATGMAA